MFSRNVLQARLFHPNYTVADDPYSYPTPNIEPEHFWSKRDDVKKVRRQVLFQWVFVSIQLWILIFLMAALYLGQGRNPDGYTRNLDVLVVNFDQELAGDFFIDAFEQSGPGSLTLHWHYRAPSDFSFDPNNTRMEIFYEEGRNPTGINNYMLPAIRTAIMVASQRYGQYLRSTLIQRILSANDNAIILNSSLIYLTSYLLPLLSNPLNYSQMNFHPAQPFIGQLATTLG
ncbi:unnamed protein product, partial [Didymodactylos carnosus]